jgi:hypothetical protein
MRNTPVASDIAGDETNLPVATVQIDLRGRCSEGAIVHWTIS